MYSYNIDNAIIHFSIKIYRTCYIRYIKIIITYFFFVISCLSQTFILLKCHFILPHLHHVSYSYFCLFFPTPFYHLLHIPPPLVTSSNFFMVNHSPNFVSTCSSSRYSNYILTTYCTYAKNKIGAIVVDKI